MTWVHFASPIKRELGYAQWPQLSTKFIALLDSKLGPDRARGCLR